MDNDDNEQERDLVRQLIQDKVGRNFIWNVFFYFVL